MLKGMVTTLYNISNSQSKNECQKSSYKRGTEIRILCFVNKLGLCFCLYFECCKTNSRFRPTTNVTNTRNCLFLSKTN